MRWTYSMVTVQKSWITSDQYEAGIFVSVHLVSGWPKLQVKPLYQHDIPDPRVRIKILYQYAIYWLMITSDQDNMCPCAIPDLISSSGSRHCLYAIPDWGSGVNIVPNLRSSLCDEGRVHYSIPTLRSRHYLCAMIRLGRAGSLLNPAYNALDPHSTQIMPAP